MDSEIVSRRRVRLASVLAWALAAVCATILFGVIDLGTTVGLADQSYHWSMSLEASWGSLFTFVVALAFAAIGAAPTRPWPAVALLSLVAVGLALGGATLGDPGPLTIAVPLALVTAAFALALRPFLRPSRPAWRVALSPVAVVAALGVPLWFAYAWLTHRAAGTASAGDDTLGVDHWPVQVALGLIVAAGSALLIGSWRGLALWRWSFALTAVAVAWATLRYPDRAGAMPSPAWGVLIALWGVLLVCLARAGRGEDGGPTGRPRARAGTATTNP